MSNMMRALVKARAEPGIWMEDRPVPEIGPNDVLIKIKKTATCGTDVVKFRFFWRASGSTTAAAA